MQYLVTFTPTRGGYGPIASETVTLGTVDTLEAADALVAEHNGRQLWGRKVSEVPTVGAMAREASHALHLIGRGSYRYAEVEP